MIRLGRLQTSSSYVQFFQQLIRPPQMWDSDTSPDDHRDIQRFLLLDSRGAQTICLNHVIENAVIAAQAGRGNQSHQLFCFSRQSAFQIIVVIEVVITFDEEVIRLVDVGVEARASVEKASGDLAFFCYLLFAELIHRLPAFLRLALGNCGMLAGGCVHAQIVAEKKPDRALTSLVDTRRTGAAICF